jgi:dihydrofolate reductase
MRKVILQLAVSLDGFIEGPNGEYDWCFTDQDYGMTAFLNRIDAIFFGRKSYELLQKFEENPYPDKNKYVFSTTVTSLENTTIISDNVENKVNQLKTQQGKDMWLFGGASLTTVLINAGLVDELMLSVHPLILGAGRPLFKDILQRTSLELMNTQSYNTGLVQLSYHILKG